MRELMEYQKVGDGELAEAIFMALGAASACWESLDGTGEFQSDRASALGQDLIEIVGQRVREAVAGALVRRWMPSGLPPQGFDVDKLLQEILDQTHGPLADDAPAELRTLHHKVNQLADWMSGGSPLPRMFDEGQRTGPFARPVAQQLEQVADGQHTCWACAGCQAALNEVTGVLSHRPGCRELRR